METNGKKKLVLRVLEWVKFGNNLALRSCPPFEKGGIGGIFRVLRFDDREVLLQMNRVLEAIFQATEKSLLTSLCKREEPSIKMSSGRNSALAPEYSVTHSKAR